MQRLRSTIVLLVAICACAGSAHGQPPGNSAVRTLWEYKTVTMQQGVDPNNQFARGIKLFENGEPLTASVSVVEYANQLGAQGWELVSVAATENTTYRVHVYWFKRAKR